ncbi:MAG: hypothetical protein IJY24_01095 [Clostridia bacterium]|nr:hypothetical protein [Clostridia bacterium]
MKRKLLLLALVVALCVCSVGVLSASAEGDNGLTFSSGDMIVTNSIPEKTPSTLEAVVNLPTANAVRGSIFGSYIGASRVSYGLEVTNANAPRLFCQVSSAKGISLVFSQLKLNKGVPVHLAVTIDKSVANQTTATCYITYTNANGETVTESQQLSATLAAPASWGSTVVIGNDHRPNTKFPFPGEIYSVAAYSDMRTADEVKGDIFNFSDNELIIAYDMAASYPRNLYDLSGNGYHLVHTNTNEGIDGVSYGMNFDTTVHKMTKLLDAMPTTLEAWAYLPSDQVITGNNRMGVIFGNYSAGGQCFNLEIAGGGVVRLYFTNSEGTINGSFYFTDEDGNNLDLRLGRWAHLSVVKEADAFLLYIDGELASRMPYTLGYGSGIITNSRFAVGGDLRSGNTQYFKGGMQSLYAFSDVRTAEEIRADMISVDANAEGLVFGYDFTKASPSDELIADISGNGYSLITNDWLSTNPNSPTDYAYSMAVVGDTQFLAQNDANNGTNYTSEIYKWLVENKDSKNIKYVMGLGDITENDTDAEWQIAKDAITQLDGILPYSLVKGAAPHDRTVNFNKYFGSHEPYTSQIDGYFTYGDATDLDSAPIDNTYRKITIGDTRYLIFGLDFGASDAVLEWAGDIIAQNMDHRVIITTHAYLYGDGTYWDENDSAPAHKPGVSNGLNNGDEIWEKMVKRYPNIVMVLNGHCLTENIVMTQAEGIYGNTVTQMLINFQASDASHDYRTGMVAMFYFSADGSKIDVEYISTVRDRAGEPALYQEINQFSVELLDENDYCHGSYASDGSVYTSYGTIPAEWADATKYPFVVFVPDVNSPSGYTAKATAPALISDANIGVSASGCAFHKLRVDALNVDGAVILMRQDYYYTADASYSNLTLNVPSFTLDLGGYTIYDLHTHTNGFFYWYAKNNDKVPHTTFTTVVKNGSIKVLGGYLMNFADGAAAASERTFNMTFEQIRLGFAEGSTSPYMQRRISPADSMNHIVNVAFNNCVFDFANGPVGADFLQDGSLQWRVSVTKSGTAVINRRLVRPEMSLTMSDSFILNIYIPVTMYRPDGSARKDAVSAITLGGEAYIVSELPVVEVGGKEMYHIAIALSPDAMAESRELLVDVDYIYTFNGGAVTAKQTLKSGFTVDIISYLATLADNDSSVVATLGKDILSYVRAVYAYGDEDDEARSAIARIDSIIGTDYDDNNPPADYTVSLDTEGMDSACLELGSTPAFIFYPETDDNGALIYSTDLYVFALDGRYRLNSEVCTDEGGRTYIRVTGYAYAMGGEIQYAIKGEGIMGAYNLGAYLENAKSGSDTELVRLTERLMKYAESANAYRNSVIAGEGV